LEEQVRSTWEFIIEIVTCLDAHGNNVIEGNKLVYKCKEKIMCLFFLLLYWGYNVTFKKVLMH
jgi:hypothetical protein